VKTVTGFPDEQRLVVPTDVSVHTDVDDLVSRTIDHFGLLDVFVNDAGGHLAGPIEEVSDAEWHGLFATNLDAIFYGVTATLPHLQSSGGDIVVVSSVSGIRGDWGQAAYTRARAPSTPSCSHSPSISAPRAFE